MSDLAPEESEFDNSEVLWLPSAFNINRVSARSEGNENDPLGRKISRILLPADNHINESSGMGASRAVVYTVCSKGEGNTSDNVART